MPRFAHACTAALMLSAQTVWADVTPEQVWQSWQDAATAQGQTISAKDTKRDGDTLTVTGITLTMNSDSGKGEAHLDKIGFQDKGDGTVAIILPDSYPIELTLPAAKDSPDAPKDVTITVLMPGGHITASGVPLSVSYETDLPRLDLAVEVSDGATGAKTASSILAKLTGVTGHYLIEGAEAGQNMTQDLAVKSVNVTAKTTGDGKDAAADISMTLADIVGKSALTGVPTTGIKDMDAALAAGLNVILCVGWRLSILRTMKLDSKYFDSIRVKPEEDRRARPHEKSCQWQGCKHGGTHKAPMGRGREGRYFLLAESRKKYWPPNVRGSKRSSFAGRMKKT